MGETFNKYFSSDFTAEKIMEAQELRQMGCDVLDQIQISKEEVRGSLETH